MTTFTCDLCGGDVDASRDKTHGVCKDCGATMFFSPDRGNDRIPSTISLSIAKNGVMLELIRVGEGEKAYYLGRFPVTQRQYEAVMGENPSHYSGPNHENHPVEMVSWHDAQAFCEKLNARFSRKLPALRFSLPFEEQWVEAAYAGEKTIYAGGDDLDEVGWAGDNSDEHSHAVGEKKPNAWGFYDMSGNVDEWCLDEDGEMRAYRGGGWGKCDDGCYIRYSGGGSPDDREDDRGLRVVLQSSDRVARYRKSAEEAERARIERLEKSFLHRVEAGRAIRIDLGNDESLDLIGVPMGDEAYYMGRFLVTRRQYDVVMEPAPSNHGRSDYANRPMEALPQVAMDFCRKLNDRYGKEFPGFRFTLPTEEQWVQAAYAGETTAYAGGDDPDEVCWHAGNSHYHIHDVGQKKPNGWGFHDMSGNIDEWCMDARGVICTRRGGSCNAETEFNRIDFRNATFNSGGFYGIRVVLEPENWAEERRHAAEAAERACLEVKDRPFLDEVAKGHAIRIDLADSLSLDLIQVEERGAAYYLGRTPVTRAQYEAVAAGAPFIHDLLDPEARFVKKVSWYDAMAFCKMLNERFGKTFPGLCFTLPTEEEWEKATRAGECSAPLRGDVAYEDGRCPGLLYNHHHGIRESKINAWGFQGIDERCGEWTLDAKFSVFSYRRDFRGHDEHCHIDHRDAVLCEGRYEGNAIRVALEPADWAVERRRAAETAERARLEALDNVFLKEVCAGRARRIDLNDGESLDLIRIEEGDRSYWMGRFPVTQGQYEAVTGGNPSGYNGDDSATHPVENVSWYDAMGFCEKLNERFGEVLPGLRFTLPTEAQWLKAAYAGQKTKYAGSDDLDEVGWYDGNSGGHSHAVGEKKANAWGFHDMSGNVWQWFIDEGNSSPLFSGGSWDRFEGYSTIGFPRDAAPDSRYINLGFRVVVARPLN